MPCDLIPGEGGDGMDPNTEHLDHLLGKMGADFDSDSVVCTEQRVGLMCLQYLTLLTCTGPFKPPGVLIPKGLMSMCCYPMSQSSLGRG